MDRANKYRYIGKDAFVIGVPARELTQAEWDALEDWQRTAALSAGLYQIMTKENKENGKLLTES